MKAEDKGRGAWVAPELRVFGAFEELTKSGSGGCKAPGSPTDGLFLGSQNYPLTSCPMS
jgi:hypothetical protein